MTLRSGRSRRARFATRSEKSGLSIVTSASGAMAAAASPVSRMRRSRFGSRGTTSAMPMTESSSIGNRLTRPWAAIAGPPTPSSTRSSRELPQPGDQRAAEEIARGLAGGDEEPRHARIRRMRGSRRSRSPSPIRLSPSTVSTMARPGTSARCGASAIIVWLSASIRPQEGVGGCAPSPT